MFASIPFTTALQAHAAGYYSLTNPYQLPDEMRMLEAVLEDMRRGKIGVVFTGDPEAPEVWRNGPDWHSINRRSRNITPAA